MGSYKEPASDRRRTAGRSSNSGPEEALRGEFLDEDNYKGGRKKNLLFAP